MFVLIIVLILCIIKKLKNDEIGNNDNDKDNDNDNKKINENNEINNNNDIDKYKNKNKIENFNNNLIRKNIKYYPIEKSSDDVWKNSIN